MRAFQTILSCFLFLVVIGWNQKAIASNNPALFAGRAQAYIDTAYRTCSRS